MRHLVGILLACALALLAAPASAQSYPTRPIKLLVSFPPGGASDLIARVIGAALSERMGVPIVVENRPGANGNVAGEATAHAEPDGYTLLLGPSALFAINPHLYARMAIDPLRQLLPVASLVQNELVLAANPALTAGMDFRGFVDLARRSQSAAVLRLDRQRQRAPSVDGIAQAGGRHRHHPRALQGRRSGGARRDRRQHRGDVRRRLGRAADQVGAAARARRHRRDALEGAAGSPAIAEVFPGFEVTLWQALFAPVGTPAAVVERLRKEAAIVRVLPDVVQKIAAAGAGEPWVASDAEFVARIRADNEKFGKVIETIGAKIQ